MTDQINNLDSSGVWLLEQQQAQGDFFNTNYLSPSGSVSSDNSLYSDYSTSSLSPHYTDITGASYTININLTDIESQVKILASCNYINCLRIMLGKLLDPR